MASFSLISMRHVKEVGIHAESPYNRTENRKFVRMLDESVKESEYNVKSDAAKSSHVIEETYYSASLLEIEIRAIIIIIVCGHIYI